MEDLIKQDNFISKEDASISFNIPFIQTSEIELVPDKKLTLTDESQEILNENYRILANSHLRKDGSVMIFGTFDSLHAGHLNMLRTAKSFGDDLYIGIEDLNNALIRKKGKHEIQSSFDRIKNIQQANITSKDKVFVRKKALSDIQEKINQGVNIKTLAVGESQCDNPEIIEAVDWCLKNDIQVIAIKRLRVKGNQAEISSSAIRKDQNKGITK